MIGRQQEPVFMPQSGPLARSGMTAAVLRPNFIAMCLDETEDRAQQPWNLGNVD
jgi:hypothetical protein